MEQDLRSLLKIPSGRLSEINAVLLDAETRVVSEFLDVVSRYGTPREINRKAKKAGSLASLTSKARERNPKNLKGLRWLKQQRER